MKKIAIILSVIALITGSCKNKQSTAVSLETNLSVQAKDTFIGEKMNSSEILQEKISVLVLPPSDPIAGMGDSPDIQHCLETVLAKDSALHIIKFPYKKLMGVSYFGVFDKKYCKPITDKVKTDIIIMSDLGYNMPIEQINADLWNLWSIRIRIYNTKTEKQIDSKVKAKNIRGEEVNNFIVKRRNELISEIKTIYTAN